MGKHHKNLLNNLEELRKSIGLTQQELSESAEVSRKSINAIENGVYVPSTVLALKIAKTLNCSVEDLFQLRLKNILGDYSAWFHHGDKNFNLAALLGSAINIFVTEDSAMMISESISSGKPVTTLYPSKIKSPLRYENHISKYADLELIKRSPLYNLELRSQQNLNARITEHR